MGRKRAKVDKRQEGREEGKRFETEGAGGRGRRMSNTTEKQAKGGGVLLSLPVFRPGEWSAAWMYAEGTHCATWAKAEERTEEERRRGKRKKKRVTSNSSSIRSSAGAPREGRRCETEQCPDVHANNDLRDVRRAEREREREGEERRGVCLCSRSSPSCVPAP